MTETKYNGLLYIGFLKGFEMLKQRQVVVYCIVVNKYITVLSLHGGSSASTSLAYTHFTYPLPVLLCTSRYMYIWKLN